MTKELKPNKYVDILKMAKEETIELLSKCGDKCFVAFADWEDEFTAISDCWASISIFGVGLIKGELYVAACNDNELVEEFPQEWTSINNVVKNCYADMYRFVAANIDKTITREEADEVAESYWG